MVEPADDRTTDPVVSVIEGGIATVTLNRPERRNVLDAETINALRTVIHRLAGDENVRVVVLASTGPTFCAGADMRAALEGGDDSFARSAPRALAGLLTEMLELPKPLIASVRGDVFGGGNGLVAACDLAVAADSARFAFSEVRVGVAPAVVSVVVLMRMRPRDAARLMLTGQRVSAQTMLDAGLLSDVEAVDQVEDRVRGYCDLMSRGGPGALAATKSLLRQVPGMPIDEAFEWTASLSGRLFSSAEGREGMAAFTAKRDPSWVTGSPTSVN